MRLWFKKKTQSDDERVRKALEAKFENYNTKNSAGVKSTFGTITTSNGYEVSTITDPNDDPWEKSKISRDGSMRKKNVS